LFLDAYPLQSKKQAMYRGFRTIVEMILDKQHLSDEGLQRIRSIREEMRKTGKKQKTHGNR